MLPTEIFSSRTKYDQYEDKANIFQDVLEQKALLSSLFRTPDGLLGKGLSLMEVGEIWLVPEAHMPLILRKIANESHYKLC